MTQSGFIVAIDLGTSKISGVVGRKNENDVFSVLHQESLPSENSIRRGTIYNIDKAGAIVKKLISMLENKLSIQIGRVYISLGGQSVHTLIVKEDMDLAITGGIVTDSVIESLYNSINKFKPELKHNYSIADVEYFLDDKPEKNPVGVTCDKIEAVYRVVVGRPNLFTNIERVVSKSNLEIVDYIVAPLASADIALTEEEKDLGCAFVDFGGGTTDVAVYKGGILRQLVTIPFGGRNITRDICELNFVESDAEQYKKKFGKAKEGNEGFAFASPFTSKPDIDLVELNKVIVLRLDEITLNIKEQIRLSGYSGELGAGVVITGGASKLKNIDLYLNQKLNMPIRKASSKKNVINNVSELVSDPSATALLGVLVKGKENCEYIKPKVVAPEPIVKDKEPKKEPIAEEKPDNRGSKLWGIFGSKDTDKDKRQSDKNPKNLKEPKQQNKFGDVMKDMFSGMFEDPEENN